MKIGILGTGMVGRTLAGKLSELGHDVMAGTRDVATTVAHTEPNQYGLPAFSSWQRERSAVRLETFAGAAGHGETVINATGGMVSLEALRLAGEESLGDKILIDVSNPLDFSRGMPPTLSVSNTDSVGEQIQREFPRVKVVKALNTVTAPLMVNPGLVGNGDHTLFICGDDAAAKAEVSLWLAEWFGWQDIVDLGNITNARGMEMYLPLWLRLWGALGTGTFNVKVKVVR